jgi:predicted XRE-type DNA-binding protein
MNNKIDIPDSYFDDEEFLLGELNEDAIIGILGPNATDDQILKYELCRIISARIREKGYSNSEAGKITGSDASDISRLINFHIDRFTIDRLLKVLGALENSKYVWKSMAHISELIEKRIA